jgi:hypothetical protein
MILSNKYKALINIKNNKAKFIIFIYICILYTSCDNTSNIKNCRIQETSTTVFNRQVNTVTGEIILNIYNIISNDLKKHINTSLIN